MDEAPRESVTTKADVRIAVTRLENKIEFEFARLGTKIEFEFTRLGTQIEFEFARLGTKIDLAVRDITIRTAAMLIAFVRGARLDQVLLLIRRSRQ